MHAPESMTVFSWKLQRAISRELDVAPMDAAVWPTLFPNKQSTKYAVDDTSNTPAAYVDDSSPLLLHVHCDAVCAHKSGVPTLS
jgi:hypothetical protein